MKHCEDILQSLRRNEDAWPFLAPVTAKDVSLLFLCHRDRDKVPGASASGSGVFAIPEMLPCLRCHICRCCRWANQARVPPASLSPLLSHPSFPPLFIRCGPVGDLRGKLFAADGPADHSDKIEQPCRT